MTTIVKEFSLAASADQVWDALRDFGALHTKLVPGFVTNTELDGDARIVTFSNGSVARERLITIDDERRRLVYAIASERLTHHNASAQVLADGSRGCRFVWTVDLCPPKSRPISTDRWIWAAQR